MKWYSDIFFSTSHSGLLWMLYLTSLRRKVQLARLRLKKLIDKLGSRQKPKKASLMTSHGDCRHTHTTTTTTYVLNNIQYTLYMYMTLFLFHVYVYLQTCPGLVFSAKHVLFCILSVHSVSTFCLHVKRIRIMWVFKKEIYFYHYIISYLSTTTMMGKK